MFSLVQTEHDLPSFTLSYIFCLSWCDIGQVIVLILDSIDYTLEVMLTLAYNILFYSFNSFISTLIYNLIASN
jgi:hypothetical protein